MQIIVSFSDRSLANYANRMEELAAGSGRVALAQALNQAGAEIRHATVAAETGQTGLPEATLDRAQHEIPAAPSTLAFTITARGGNVRLKYFHPSEGGGGVTADPWNRPTLYEGEFMTSGRPGARYLVGKLNGQVYHRVTSRLAWNKNTKAKIKSPISGGRSGLFIPVEMTKGVTSAAFNAGVGIAATRIVTRLGALLP